MRGEVPRQTFVAMDSRMRFIGSINVYARTQGDPRPVMARLRDRVRRVIQNLVLSDMRTLDGQLHMRLANERLLSFLSAGLAILASLLAVAGLHGVLAFVVVRRTRKPAFGWLWERKKVPYPTRHEGDAPGHSIGDLRRSGHRHPLRQVCRDAAFWRQIR